MSAITACENLWDEDQPGILGEYQVSLEYSVRCETPSHTKTKQKVHIYINKLGDNSAIYMIRNK